MNSLKASLLSLCGVIAVVSTFAQPNDQWPVSTNVPEPTPAPQASPLLTPSNRPVAAYFCADAFARPQSDAASGRHNALPLRVPTPVLQDAKTLSDG